MICEKLPVPLLGVGGCQKMGSEECNWVVVSLSPLIPPVLWSLPGWYSDVPYNEVNIANLLPE